MDNTKTNTEAELQMFMEASCPQIFDGFATLHSGANPVRKQTN